VVIFFTTLFSSGNSKSAIPAFTLPMLNGGYFTFPAQSSNNITVLSFWDTACEPCLKELSFLSTVYTNEAYEEKLTVLALSTDSKAKYKTVRKKSFSLGLPFPVLLDSQKKVFRIFSGQKVPMLVIISQSGKILYKSGGYCSSSKQDIIHTIETALLHTK
jgi:peroxiredoxin